MSYCLKYKLVPIILGLILSLSIFGGTNVFASNGNTTVTIGQSIDPETLDPACDTMLASISTMTNIYDCLVVRRSEDLEIGPSLATSWEYINPTTLEFKLRKNVKFHNGEDFTADDVVFTFNRLMDEGDPVPMGSYLKGVVKSIEKVNDYVVRIHTSKPRATLIVNLLKASILPKDTFEEMGREKFGNNPVGTGPFKFVRWKKNEEIVLEAFEDYWRGKPKIDKLIIKPIPEEYSRYAALTRGEVDIIVNVPPIRVESIEQNSDLKLGKVHSSRNMFVGMNTFEPPFDDVRVRRAMNYAVDVEQIVQTILNGYGEPNPSVFNQVIFGYDPNIEPYPYNPEKAKELLSEAGYPDGFTTTMWGPSGRYICDSEIQEAIAGQLRKVGVTVEHIMPEWARLWGAYSGKKIKGMVFLGTGNTDLDGDMTLAYRIDTDRGGKYYHSSEVQDLIDKQQSEVDQGKRKKILSEIQHIIRDDAPWIFLYDPIDLYGMRSRINWQPRPDEMIWGYDITVSE